MHRSIMTTATVWTGDQSLKLLGDFKYIQIHIRAFFAIRIKNRFIRIDVLIISSSSMCTLHRESATAQAK